MDVSSVKIGVFEVPVVVICRHSPLLQPKLSWSSTIKVAVQHIEQDVLHECAKKKNEDLVVQASETCLCAGVLPPLQLSKDEDYAKILIDQNKGIVEVGAAWPTCQRKSLPLRIVWHDIKALLEVDSRSKDQHTGAATLAFVLLIGARFVEAFSIYQQRRQLLMSLSILPFHEQQVAHEIKLLLVHIIKSLQNHPQFNTNFTQDDVEERVLVNIMNILVDVQLSDDKKATEMPLLSESGDLVVSADYLRILKHKMLSELVALLQNVLALRFPSKDSVDYSRLDEREEGARDRVFCMRRAVLDIIELLKHTSRAGNSCTETCLDGEMATTSFNFMGKNGGGREKMNKCIQEQMVQIQWKWLLAVLEKKDPVSLENILCSIQDEDKRWLLKIMAWPLDLVRHEELDEDDEKLYEELASTSTDFVVKADLGGHRPGALDVNSDVSCGYYVKSNDELSGQLLFQEREPEQHSDTAFTGAVRTDTTCCQPACANEGGGQSNAKYFEQHAEESHVQGPEAGGQLECQEHALLQYHPKESCIQGQGAGGQSECQEHAPTEIQARSDSDVDESPSSQTHQLQAHMCSNPIQASGGLQITNQAVSETAADSHIPDYTCSYAASDNDGDDDFRDGVEVSKARRRKRRNRKTHRIKENQDLPCSPQSQRLAVRKIWLVVTMAFIFGATVIGILWFQSDFSSKPRTRECRAFARGYLL